jgi:hypothetical protein
VGRVERVGTGGGGAARVGLGVGAAMPRRTGTDGVGVDGSSTSTTGGAGAGALRRVCGNCDGSPLFLTSPLAVVIARLLFFFMCKFINSCVLTLSRVVRAFVPLPRDVGVFL